MPIQIELAGITDAIKAVEEALGDKRRNLDTDLRRAQIERQKLENELMLKQIEFARERSISRLRDLERISEMNITDEKLANSAQELSSIIVQVSDTAQPNKSSSEALSPKSVKLLSAVLLVIIGVGLNLFLVIDSINLSSLDIWSTLTILSIVMIMVATVFGSLSQVFGSVGQRYKRQKVYKQQAIINSNQHLDEIARDIAKVELQSNLQKIELETEKMQQNLLELEEKLNKERLEVAFSMLEKLNPDLNEEERLKYAKKLIKPLSVILESPLNLNLRIPTPPSE